MICCVCGHPLELHVEESRDVWFGSAISAWWRCHHLAPDGYQCECRLLKWADGSKLSDYDVDRRAEELIRSGL